MKAADVGNSQPGTALVGCRWRQSLSSLRIPLMTTRCRATRWLPSSPVSWLRRASEAVTNTEHTAMPTVSAMERPPVSNAEDAIPP